MVSKNKYEVSFYKHLIKFLKTDGSLLFINSLLLNKSTHFFKIPIIILISQQKNVLFFNAS